MRHTTGGLGNADGQDAKVSTFAFFVSSILALENPWRARLLLAMLLVLVSTAMQVAAPLFFSSAIDSIGKGHPTTSSLYNVGAFAALLVGARVVGEQRWLIYMPAEYVWTKSLRTRFVAHILSLPFLSGSSQSLGRLDAISYQGVQAMRAIAVNLLFGGIPLLVHLGAVSVILCSQLSYSLSAILLITLAIYFMLLVKGVSRVSEEQSLAVESAIDAQAIANDTLLNRQSVKQHAAERKFLERYDYALTESGRRWFSFYHRLGILGVCLTAILLSGFFSMSLISLNETISGRMTLGEVVLINTYLLQLLSVVDEASFAFRDIRQSITSVDRLAEAMAIPPEFDDGPKRSIELDGPIVLNDITFAYPDRSPLFDGLSLTIHPNQITVLRGASGIGKSTLVALLVKLYDPQSGVITINGRSLPDIGTTALRQNVSVVAQDLSLFNSTLKFNITLGSDSETDWLDRVVESCALSDLIRRLPQGLGSMVGERGFRISAGERQRILLARAVFRQPKLLILDEPTSALDRENEARILKSLRSAVSGTSVLLITHSDRAEQLADQAYEIRDRRAFKLARS